ncbi:hypothetical protein PN498_24940 [Oscillatoria sp. CS-180]|uniref:hypothetical protein n=1 Tax=Oscillatoria sp. CS-180 TaxID=3021720 RepID=UPI0023303B4E|nr:hypothetical protein [Oscillatoria sp. CS-180]MDB9529263.1 hypothetical protein [Oscillatoria sp. CS-180]
MFEYLLRRYQPTPGDVLEVLELHQLAIEFKQEQHYREALEAHYQEYDQLVEQNQRDHAAMQQEPNLFALFCKKRQ